MRLHDLLDHVVLLGKENGAQRNDALQLARGVDNVTDVDGLFVRTGAANAL